MMVMSTVAVPTSNNVGHRRSQEHLHHRLPLIQERRPELPAKGVAGVREELGRQGLVQAEFGDQLLLRRLRELDPFLLRQQLDRIARHDPEQEEVEHQDEREGRQRLQDLLDDVPTAPQRQRSSSDVVRIGAAPPSRRSRAPMPPPSSTDPSEPHPPGRAGFRRGEVRTVDRADRPCRVRVPPEHDAVGFGPRGGSRSSDRRATPRIPSGTRARSRASPRRASAASGCTTSRRCSGTIVVCCSL